MKVEKGLRIVRGPDWERGNEDGGEGGVGTVVNVTREVGDNVKGNAATVRVQWDCGGPCYDYRCGKDNKYDLTVFDTAQIGIVHRNPDSTHYFTCNSCKENGVENAIVGLRWKCFECKSYQLCTKCYNEGRHLVEHSFFRIEEYGGGRTLLPPRANSRRLTAKGLFISAEVECTLPLIIGGGAEKSGKLVEVGEYESGYRCVGMVDWSGTIRKGWYCIGHKGKVDLKCTKPASGGYYYPDHLPALGKTLSRELQPTDCIECGDAVYINTVDLAVFKSMQEGRGVWRDTMSEVFREIGIVQRVLESGDIQVHFPRIGDYFYTINPKALSVIQHPGEKKNSSDSEHDHGDNKQAAKAASTPVLTQYTDIDVDDRESDWQPPLRESWQSDPQLLNTHLTPTRHGSACSTPTLRKHKALAQPPYKRYSGEDIMYWQSMQAVGSGQVFQMLDSQPTTPTRHGTTQIRGLDPTSWWTPVASMDDVPTLQHLLSFTSMHKGVFDISERVGTKYTKFGIFLLEDDQGSRVDALETTFQMNAARINYQILKSWIQGQGLHPVSWRTLVGVLHRMNLTALAQEICESLC